MNKTLKKIIIIAASVVGAAGLAAAGVLIFAGGPAEVAVYPASDFVNYYAGYTNETQGNVTADKMQSVYISSTQTVCEIFVKEGDSVKAGDKLLAYDTTLSDIELEKASIKLERLKLDLQAAEKELKNINNLVPYSSEVITPEPLGIVYEPHDTKVVIAGDGSFDSPYYYLWSEDDAMCAEDLAKLIDARRLAGAETEEVYVTFIIRENNALNAPIVRSFGIYAVEDTEGLSWSFYEPVLSEEIQAYESEPESYIKESGSPYTAKEIAEMKKEKQAEITEINSNIQIAQVELDRITVEVNDGTVCSKYDGTVTICRDADEAYANNEPVIIVSGGGGFLIESTISESLLDIVVPGKTVEVVSYMSGASIEGTVTEVSQYPDDASHYYYSSNTNNSYYPFTVSVPEDAGLTEGDYVGITFSAESDEGKIYIESMFVRDENGRKYIMVEDENGRLEKRFVTTGSVDYSTTCITSGLSEEDYIAFPYGTEVREGARTYHAQADELYMSAY